MSDTDTHYVDNKRFFEEISIWKEEWQEAFEDDEPLPPITEYLGECFLKISQRLCYLPNFIGYSYRDDFISDGYENCILYAKNFDAKKSNNPFAYFTQIIYYSFLRRIAKEKKQHTIKHKIINDSNVMETILMDGDIDNAKYLKKHLEYLKEIYDR
jgi:hypothetical protein